MTTHSVASALTLYRSGTLTIEAAAMVAGCSPEQLHASARPFEPTTGTASGSTD
ncbi:DUF7317 family protein [Halorubrum vacuolatum]|uniref:HTH araC/xylS-type domain-containing protein n=1 Tax=Halorubrum vacuolatum TaxID=63740 RepID=A0A238UXR1_HALVU|nr:hypothetical protein [Halorubrum vacuolatum]SNR26059.1 hypothetical protein SAMN06264855_101439 [Halorubrum vacuolatum]